MIERYKRVVRKDLSTPLLGYCEKRSKEHEA
jgi:hypothetical protein